MQPEKLPLEPLISPPPIGWWPPAPGWLFLALVLLALLIWGVVLLRRRFFRVPGSQDVVDPLVRQALSEFQQLLGPYEKSAGPWLQQINALLKRLCSAQYPQDHCVTLTGKDWLLYLDRRCPSAGLSRQLVLVEGAYQPDCRLDDRAIESLQQAVVTWIRQHV